MSNPASNALTSMPATLRKKRSLGIQYTFWTTGKTLRISFLGQPEPTLKQSIFTLASEWTLHANINFELLQDNVETDEIRIATDVPSNMNRSAVGTLALTYEGPSMCLGTRPGDEKFRTIVLHEFGHALGMLHEHQHPDAAFDWSMDYLRTTFFAKSPYASEEHFEQWIATNYTPFSVNSGLEIAAYDTHSIMHYGISADRVNGGATTQRNEHLSAGDIAFMRMHYPGR